MNYRAIAMLAAATALGPLALPAAGHHSYAATYFEDRTETVEGAVVQFLFRNPHSFLYVDVKQPQGVAIRYAVEWAAGLQLNRQGVTQETLRPGDHIVVTGNPSRTSDDHRLRMKGIIRQSDGWKWGGPLE